MAAGVTDRVWELNELLALGGQEMAERIQLPPEAQRGAQMKIRKGWRLVTPDKRRAFKGALVGKFNSMKGRFAIFRID